VRHVGCNAIDFVAEVPAFSAAVFRGANVASYQGGATPSGQTLRAIAEKQNALGRDLQPDRLLFVPYRPDCEQSELLMVIAALWRRFHIGGPSRGFVAHYL
jgi:hypothetical protein